MNIYPIKAFSDNYIWCIQEGTEAVVVDPGEARGVLDYFGEKQLRLTAILLTHKHEDHTGGVKEILAKFPETPVYGSERKQLLWLTAFYRKEIHSACWARLFKFSKRVATLTVISAI